MANRQIDSSSDVVPVDRDDRDSNPTSDLFHERLAVAEKRAELAEKRADLAEARADQVEKKGSRGDARLRSADRGEPSDPAREGLPAPRHRDENENDFRRDPDEEHGPKKRRGLFIMIAIVLAIVLIVVFVVTRHRDAAKAKEGADAGPGGKGAARAVPVSVAAVEQRDVPVFLDGLGNVNAMNTVTVKTRIDGQLLRFNFQEGQVVHAGEEIALIDPAPSLAQLAQAEATRFKDAAALENARRDLERYHDLYRAGVIPQQQYNTQQSQVGVNEGTVKADDAQVQQAKLNVAYCHIKAPITGRVGIRNVDAGNMVHASDANGLVVITQVQPIAVLFTLPEDQLPAVTKQLRGAGLPIEAWSRDNSQKLADGKLLTIDNQIDPNTGTFRCKGVFDNTDSALYPNQFINARLRVDVRRGALTVPAAAVQRGGQGTYVYVVGADKTVEMKQVQVELTEGTTDVLSGEIQVGEQVVIDGADKLQPHAKVQVAGASGAGGGGKGAAGGHRGTGSHGGAAAGRTGKRAAS